MVKVVNFGGDFEKDMVKIEGEVRSRQEFYTGQDVPKKKIVKEAIQGFITKESTIPIAVPTSQATVLVAPPNQNQTSTQNVLPAYLQGDDADPKIKEEVKKLVSLVFNSGIETALKEAKKKNPFVEDAFHDALVEHLVPELKRRGILN